MSTSQSTSTTTTTSQITGKRKRVDSADGVENAKDSREDEKRKEGIHDFLADVVELLRRLVTDLLARFAGTSLSFICSHKADTN